VREVTGVIGRFANSFDLKDWSGLEGVLSEEIAVDYELRGQQGTLTRAEFVHQRRAALDALETHHLLGNLEVDIEGDTAVCVASGVIYRRKGEDVFDSHVIYHFRLRRTDGVWRISALAQRVLWNEGNPVIHSGTDSTPGS
jgi:hypothetical protein